MQASDDLIEVDRRQLVEVQDVVRDYKHPSTVDIKVGLHTWYAGAEPSYVHRCKLKKAATMQAALSYKVCRMQVSVFLGMMRNEKDLHGCVQSDKEIPLPAAEKHRIHAMAHLSGRSTGTAKGGCWRASKRWCKQLLLAADSKALIRFANNEAGL